MYADSIKPRRMLLSCLFLLLLLNACSSSTRISGDLVDELRRQMLDDHPSVRQMELNFEPLTFRLEYTLNEPIDDEEQAEIFEASRSLLMSEAFEKEIIDSPKIRRYFPSGHPNFVISFRVRGEDHTSRFKLYADNSKEAEFVYKEWYYAEGDDVVGEPVAEENK